MAEGFNMLSVYPESSGALLHAWQEYMSREDDLISYLAFEGVKSSIHRLTGVPITDINNFVDEMNGLDLN